MGRAAQTADKTTTAHTKHPLVICGVACADGSRRPFSYYGMRVYRWKIWDEGALVRDFVPCRRAYDGEAGLLDRVSGRFYENAGTGSFSAGEDHDYAVYGYTRLEYLQSSGTQIIDVDYLANPTTHLLLDYSLQGTCNRSRGGCANLFGAAESDATSTFACNFGGGSGQENELFMWLNKTYSGEGNTSFTFRINTLPLRTRMEIFASSGGVTNGTAYEVAVKRTNTSTRTLAIFGTHAASGASF